jgi:hypothetical protein
MRLVFLYLILKDPNPLFFGKIVDPLNEKSYISTILALTTNAKISQKCTYFDIAYASNEYIAGFNVSMDYIV